MPRSLREFGKFVKAKRIALGLTLRKAAQELGVSAAYVSRVENGEEKPSGPLIAGMSRLYGVPVLELTKLADSSEQSAASAHGESVRTRPELRALYRLGNEYDTETIDRLLRAFLNNEGITDEAEIERKLLELKAEFPRIAKGTDNLLAAHAVPRFLTKRTVENLAYGFMQRHGLSPDSYAPPTEVEMLVEMEPGVEYRVDDLKCTKRGDPLVLGLSCWSADGNRQIVINSALADSRRATDVHRFNFTLGHELFHAIEHLPRTRPGRSLNRIAEVEGIDEIVFLEVLRPVKIQRTPAERAVKAWVQSGRRRRLLTDEDWREWQANTFAAALLMPEWAVKPEFEKRVGKPTVISDTDPKEEALRLADEILFTDVVYEQSLADKFAVSRQAMAIRLLDLGLIGEVRGQE